MAAGNEVTGYVDVVDDDGGGAGLVGVEHVDAAIGEDHDAVGMAEVQAAEHGVAVEVEGHGTVDGVFCLGRQVAQQVDGVGCALDGTGEGGVAPVVVVACGEARGHQHVALSGEGCSAVVDDGGGGEEGGQQEDALLAVARRGVGQHVEVAAHVARHDGRETEGEAVDRAADAVAVGPDGEGLRGLGGVGPYEVTRVARVEVGRVDKVDATGCGAGHNPGAVERCVVDSANIERDALALCHGIGARQHGHKHGSQHKT